MPNPTLPLLGRDPAIALGGTNHAIGLPYIGFDDSDQSSPTIIDKVVSGQLHTWNLLLRAAMGAAVQLATGLTVHVFAANYRVGTTRLYFDGGSINVPNSTTSYVYLNDQGALAVTTGAFPADVFRVAVVTADATKITSIVDARAENYGIGGTNSWYNVAAGANVDFNGKSLRNAGSLVLPEETQLVISAGSITPTRLVHDVAPESGTEDDLTDIAAVTGERRLVILTGAYSPLGFSITVKQTGNISLSTADDLVLTPAAFVCLYQNSDTTWTELFRSVPAFGTPSAELDFNTYGIEQLGPLNFYGPAVANISAGNIGRTRTVHALNNEGGATTDDLDTATLGSAGDLLILKTATAGKTTTVKHSASANGFRLANQRDFVMDTVYHVLTCIHDGSQWVEISRSPMKSSASAGTDNAIYTPVMVHIPGTLSIGNDKRRLKLEHDCIIKRATIEAVTGPSGGDLIVDVVVNGLSIFTNQSEMARITDGQTSGNSATKNHAYTAGQLIYLEPEAVNSAADVTVTLHTYQKVQVPPG